MQQMNTFFRIMMQLPTLILVAFAASAAAIKEPELPLCPTNIQFFPQNLPMHCRMPRSVAGAPPGLSMPPGIQMPQGLMPPFQMPGLPMQPGAQMSMPMNAPQVAMPIPAGPMPGGPMPGGPMMPMMMPGPPAGAKLPVIVMPFYKPEKNYADSKKKNNNGKPWWYSDSDTDRSHEKRKHHHKWWDHDSDTDSSSSSTTDTDSDTDRYSLWGGRRAGGGRTSRRSGSKKHHHRQNSRKNKQSSLYTPVLQYVTKDGYVIYEKKISTGEAKDWLNINTKDQNIRQNREDENASVGDDEGDNAMQNLHEQRRRPKAEIEHVEPVVIHKRKNPRAGLKNKPALHTNAKTRS